MDRRKPRNDKGQMRWTERDLAVLRWIGEQYAVRLDHVQILLGQATSAQTQEPGKVAETTARNTIERWRRAEVVRFGSLLAKEPGWVWLSRKGLRLLGLQCKYWQPTPGALRHLYYVNQVRLWVEERHPGGYWHAERILRTQAESLQARARVGHIADAEFVDQEQTVAIEVELSKKEELRLQAILYGLAAKYAAIWYFVPPGVQAHLERALTHLDAASKQKIFLVPFAEEEIASPAKRREIAVPNV